MAIEAHLKEHRIAVFFDFENIIQGVRDANYDKFRLELILDRLVEKGKVIFKRAYCDWGRFRDHKNDFHEAAVELIDIPTKRISGKNSADIRMVVDALDLCYRREHITAFALITGDSDFSPLVNKLTEYNKHVIGIGVKNSTSELLVSVCDEFIFYEDLVREKQHLQQQQQQQRQQRQQQQQRGPAPSSASPAPVSASAASSPSNAPAAHAPSTAPMGGGNVEEIFGLMMDAFAALRRENYDNIWGSMIKQQIKRKKPQFTEAYFGFRNFSDVLEAAKKAGLIELKRDQRSGSYVVLESGGGGGDDGTGGGVSGGGSGPGGNNGGHGSANEPSHGPMGEPSTGPMGEAPDAGDGDPRNGG